jgi:hypothetical protein
MEDEIVRKNLKTDPKQKKIAIKIMGTESER